MTISFIKYVHGCLTWFTCKLSLMLMLCTLLVLNLQADITSPPLCPRSAPSVTYSFSDLASLSLANPLNDLPLSALPHQEPTLSLYCPLSDLPPFFSLASSISLRASLRVSSIFSQTSSNNSFLQIISFTYFVITAKMYLHISYIFLIIPTNCDDLFQYDMLYK